MSKLACFTGDYDWSKTEASCYSVFTSSCPPCSVTQAVALTHPNLLSPRSLTLYLPLRIFLKTLFHWWKVVQIPFGKLKKACSQRKILNLLNLMPKTRKKKIPNQTPHLITLDGLVNVFFDNCGKCVCFTLEAHHLSLAPTCSTGYFSFCCSSDVWWVTFVAD